MIDVGNVSRYASANTAAAYAARKDFKMTTSNQTFVPFRLRQGEMLQVLIAATIRRITSPDDMRVAGIEAEKVYEDIKDDLGGVLDDYDFLRFRSLDELAVNAEKLLDEVRFVNGWLQEDEEDPAFYSKHRDLLTKLCEVDPNNLRSCLKEYWADPMLDCLAPNPRRPKERDDQPAMSKTAAIRAARQAVAHPMLVGREDWMVLGPAISTEDGLSGPSTSLVAGSYKAALALRTRWVASLALCLMGWGLEDAENATQNTGLVSVESIVAAALA